MILGLDISTSVVGIALFNDDYKLFELTHIKFKKGTNLFVKLDEFIIFFEKNFPLTPITYIHIEEPLKKFKGKFSNAHTIQILTQMNAMISGYLYRKLKIQPVYFNVSKARKMVFPELKFPEGANKKYIIWGAVMKVHPEINWKYSAKTHMLMDENFDMCDAWVVGMAGIVSMIRMQKAKTKKDKTTA